MRIPLERAEFEMEARKSKFLAFALPCTSLSQVKALVAQLKSEHPGANHVVHAAVVGEHGDEFSYSDDREPKNTAGRPALEVLKGSGITNVAILIVRYFGGTLLGTGGLVKAYGESAKGVLEILRTEELIEKCSFSITTSYNLYEPIKKILIASDATIGDEQFATEVTLTGTLATARKLAVEMGITELSNGRAQVVFTE
ncbi:YigZ family protein [Sphaerochaeta sp. PS]|uniref:IMPACT family protein n=1 Tax=Sphaerochaeta sp. PS TaxID=3076336 RepID=UPI0028A47AAD|nr:YigZ family protein [Sphaerochaeta sp. PS]MDT4762426.1 YigZ family protein [Sphaerochaeta sp. PS]